MAKKRTTFNRQVGKTVTQAEMVLRLRDELGITKEIALEVHKAYCKIYEDMLKNGECIKLPYIGALYLNPFDMQELVYSPYYEKKIPRVQTHEIKFIPSQELQILVKSIKGRRDRSKGNK